MRGANLFRSRKPLLRKACLTKVDQVRGSAFGISIVKITPVPEDREDNENFG